MHALFVGLGGVGQRHLRNLKSLHPEARVSAVRRLDRRFEVSNALAADAATDIVAKYAIERFPDLDAAIAAQPDVAVVANPTALHAETAMALVAAGIPVLLEKPATVTADQYRALEAAAGSVPVMVAYQLRWHPSVVRLKSLIDQGVLGRIHAVEVAVHSHMPSWHAYEKPTDFYAGRADLGGGVVLTEIHELDLLAWLFGTPTQAFAVGGCLGADVLDVEDTVAATLALPGGVPASVTLSFVQRPPMRRLAVNGEHGRLVMDIPRQTLAWDKADGTSETWREDDFDRNLLFIAEMEHFLDCVARRTQPSSSLTSARGGQMLADAIRRSLASGQPEQIP